MNDFLSLPNENMNVFVKVAKHGAPYSAQIVGQHKREKHKKSTLMQTSVPLTRMLLEQLLESFGFHQRDVFDALNIKESESVWIKHPLW